MSDHDNTDALLSDQDQVDLASLAADAGLPVDFEYHPILMVWREVLKPAVDEANKKVTPQWASRICAQYQGITFGDMLEFQARYYAKISELTGLLNDEIATDGDCLSYSTAEEDLAENHGHYLNLLRDWQKQVLGWELAWDTSDPHAGIELAAISEVHKLFFGQTGLTQYLENIKLEIDESWQNDLAAELEAMKEGQ